MFAKLVLSAFFLATGVVLVQRPQSVSPVDPEPVVQEVQASPAFKQPLPLPPSGLPPQFRIHFTTRNGDVVDTVAPYLALTNMGSGVQVHVWRSPNVVYTTDRNIFALPARVTAPVEIRLRLDGANGIWSVKLGAGSNEIGGNGSQPNPLGSFNISITPFADGRVFYENFIIVP